MHTRRFLAAIVAPLVGVIVGCLGLVATAAVVFDADSATPRWSDIFEHWLGFYLVFGLPPAYLAEAFALAFYRAKYPSEPPRLWVATAVAASFGAMLVFVVWATLVGARFGLAILPSGLVGGAVAGVVYWVAGVRPSHSAPVV